MPVSEEGSLSEPVSGIEPVGIAAKMVALHTSLADNRIDHAFGGALALAWCTQQARGTIGIDLNLFVGRDRTDEALAALPTGIEVTALDLELLSRDGQARLWWGAIPVDVFLNTTWFHDQVATRVRWEPFVGVELPFLAYGDLAVFKAFFNRTRDWADLEAMQHAGTLDIASVIGVLTVLLGAGDERIERLLALNLNRACEFERGLGPPSAAVPREAIGGQDTGGPRRSASKDQAPSQAPISSTDLSLRFGI